MTPSAPWVVHANYVQFGSQQRIAFDCVRSRMLLWCKAGRGGVTVNGERLEFQPGDILLTPWKHAIAYVADDREPFFLAGIHFIPRQLAATPFVADVAHTPQALPALESRRFDLPWPGLAGLRRARFGHDEPLQALADFTVRRFQQEIPTESQSRNMGTLLLSEMMRFFVRPHRPRQPMSADFQRVVQFIDDHLQQTIYLDEAARISNRSLSWLHRQFRDCLGTTPMHYIMSARIRRAQQLLTSSNMNSGEVGQAVGIDDPYYFSKLFKRFTGTSPRDYRRRASLF